MTTKTKMILGISLAAFLLSLTGALWGVFMPIGAIFLGLFLIFNLLAKEAAAFDEEERLRYSLAVMNDSTVQASRSVQAEAPLSQASAH